MVGGLLAILQLKKNISGT